MHRIIFALVFLAGSTAAYGQQTPQKDRKDFLLEALESQRNDGLSKLAICYADANEQITRLNAQLQQVTAQLADAKKATTPAPSPPQTP